MVQVTMDYKNITAKTRKKDGIIQTLPTYKIEKATTMYH